jgi:coenzyme F390 synthetase
MISNDRYYREDVETMDRENLDELINERIHHTVMYAYQHSPFYRKWFNSHRIDPLTVRSHDDLSSLPIISSADIRAHQPPSTQEFEFKSVSWEDIFTIHETSGTSGVPKSYFLTWKDWERFAEKYARAFVSQGISHGDRVIICASYGMNVGANTMTLAARNVGFTIIPTGKCNFPLRVITNYHPTGIVGSVFKLIRLYEKMTSEGIRPEESGIKKLIIGGEAYAEESKAYLSELWGCDVFNTYGSTEGTMCGECSARQGLHVPEDLVHMDIYDDKMKHFVNDGECGRIVLTTLIPEGEPCGTILLNYDTEDTSVVLSRDQCACGRTHMRIFSPQREAETCWIHGTPINRVDIERGVFQRENMEYITGEYEAFLYSGDDPDKTLMRVSMESKIPGKCDTDRIEENFLKSFFAIKPGLVHHYNEGTFSLSFNITVPRGLELASVSGRPKRLIDRR